MTRPRSLVALLCAVLLAACQGVETVPETGRRRPALQYTENEMERLGADAYRETLRDVRVITGTEASAQVERVGKRIATATGKDYDWEFALIDDPKVVNAFCLPGGKIAVYSGLLPVAKNDDGLAFIMGHEVAHATLQHGNESMSKPRWQRIVGLPVNMTVGMWGSLSPGSRRVVMDTFGIGHVVGSFMPYSQEHEWEADEVGLRYMQEAGYDVDEAPEFWRRMREMTPNQRRSDSLDTHPDAEKREKRLRELIREMHSKS